MHVWTSSTCRSRNVCVGHRQIHRWAARVTSFEPPSLNPAAPRRATTSERRNPIVCGARNTNVSSDTPQRTAPMRTPLALTALVFAAIADVSSGTATHHVVNTRDASIAIRTFQFSPDTLRVKSGTRVVWTNADEIEHTITSGVPGEAGTSFRRRRRHAPRHLCGDAREAGHLRLLLRSPPLHAWNRHRHPLNHRGSLP